LITGVQRAISLFTELPGLLRRRIEQRVETRCDERLLELFVGHRRMRRLRDLADDLRRRLRRRKQTDEVLREHTGQAGLDRGRKCGECGEAVRACHAQHADLAGLVQLHHVAGHALRDHRDMAADKVGNQRPAAPVRHMDDVRQARERLEQFAGEMCHCAGARGTE